MVSPKSGISGMRGVADTASLEAVSTEVEATPCVGVGALGTWGSSEGTCEDVVDSPKSGTSGMRVAANPDSLGVGRTTAGPGALEEVEGPVESPVGGSAEDSVEGSTAGAVTGTVESTVGVGVEESGVASGVASAVELVEVVELVRKLRVRSTVMPMSVLEVELESALGLELELKVSKVVVDGLVLEESVAWLTDSGSPDSGPPTPDGGVFVCESNIPPGEWSEKESSKRFRNLGIALGNKDRSSKRSRRVTIYQATGRKVCCATVGAVSPQGEQFPWAKVCGGSWNCGFRYPEAGVTMLGILGGGAQMHTTGR